MMVKCPICGFTGKQFDPFGRTKRKNARCPGCGSLERHRQIWLFMKKRRLLNRTKMKMLHFAAEKCFVQPLRKMFGDGYKTAGLVSGQADLVVDITAIPFKARSYNFVIANHVLEHVEDDRKAMMEIYRVLKKGGCAIITVPYRRDKEMTVESAERDVADHVRTYGRDVIDRLKKAKFAVEAVDFHEEMSIEDKIRYRVGGDTIFFCKRKK